MYFNLQTSYGRAQAYAHSAEGAAKVRLIEECLENLEATLHEQVANKLDTPIHEIWSSTQCIIEELQDADRNKAVERFAKRLLLKDVQAFKRLMAMRRKEEEGIQKELIAIQLLLGEIKETFGMP